MSLLLLVQVVQQSNALYNTGSHQSPTHSTTASSHPTKSVAAAPPRVPAIPAVDAYMSGVLIPSEISEVYCTVFSNRRVGRFARRKLAPSDLAQALGAAQAEAPDTDRVVDARSAPSLPTPMLPSIAPTPSTTTSSRTDLPRPASRTNTTGSSGKNVLASKPAPPAAGSVAKAAAAAAKPPSSHRKNIPLTTK